MFGQRALADLGTSGENDAGLRAEFPLGNQPISLVAMRCSSWFRQATALPFHDQQARSAVLAGGVLQSTLPKVLHASKIVPYRYDIEKDFLLKAQWWGWLTPSFFANLLLRRR